MCENASHAHWVCNSAVDSLGNTKWDERLVDEWYDWIRMWRVVSFTLKRQRMKTYFFLFLTEWDLNTSHTHSNTRNDPFHLSIIVCWCFEHTAVTLHLCCWTLKLLGWVQTNNKIHIKQHIQFPDGQYKYREDVLLHYSMCRVRKWHVTAAVRTETRRRIKNEIWIKI